MPSRNGKRRDLSNEGNTFKSKTIFYQENKAKARARYKADREKKKAASLCTRPLQGPYRNEEGLCTRQLQGRSRKEGVTATRPIPKRRPMYATATKPIPKKRSPLYAIVTTQILNLSNLLKGSDIKRTSWMNFLGYHTVVCWEEGSVAVVSFLHKDEKEDLMDHY